MTIFTYKLKYPEGDEKEIEHNLNFNQIVDINGIPLRLPIPSSKMIVYRVFRISTSEKRGEVIKYYYLELVVGEELIGLTR